VSGVTLIRSGLVYLESGPVTADILCDGETIAEIGRGIQAPPRATVIDADGLSVVPGFIDFHVHMDDVISGVSLADSYLSGSRAAILSGITTLMGFVTQPRDASLSEAVTAASAKVDGRSYCDVSFHLTPTSFESPNWADIDSLIERGFRTLKFYTTYKDAGLFTSYDDLRRIMSRLNHREVRILVHCEDESVLQSSRFAVADPTLAASYPGLRSPEAEIEAVDRVIQLSSETGTPVHVVHVSSPESARRINRARRDHAVSCETAPQYLLLNESILSSDGGHRYLCTPPLRSEGERRQMCELAADGAFDLFATDHCAFSRDAKDRNRYDSGLVPKGIAGVGALVPLMHQLLCVDHSMSLAGLANHLSMNPAKLAGLYPRKGTIRVGSDADFVVLSENGAPRPIRSSVSDCYATYPGRTTPLVFHYVFRRGEMVVKNNQLAASGQTEGKVLWPN
jgi:dihydropyrimidinase